jgi:hypothetical protein
LAALASPESEPGASGLAVGADHNYCFLNPKIFSADRYRFHVRVFLRGILGVDKIFIWRNSTRAWT